MQAVGTNIFGSNGTPVIIISPGQAHRLAEEGYDRHRMQETLFEGAKVPLEDMPYGNYPLCEWRTEDGKVLICPDANDVRIIIAGGGETLHSVYMQSFLSTIATDAEVWSPDRL
jgi:hypothetical protein